MKYHCIPVGGTRDQLIFIAGLSSWALTGVFQGFFPQLLPSLHLLGSVNKVVGSSYLCLRRPPGLKRADGSGPDLQGVRWVAVRGAKLGMRAGCAQWGLQDPRKKAPGDKQPVCGHLPHLRGQIIAVWVRSNTYGPSALLLPLNPEWARWVGARSGGEGTEPCSPSPGHTACFPAWAGTGLGRGKAVSSVCG